MARVACTLGARIGSGSRSTVLSGGDGHILVWVTQVKVDICKISSTYVVWLGSPSWID
jgi:hypothetical protein